jgi:hypothetical protein
MPIHTGVDSKGKYYQYGNQKKYYFKTEKGKTIAHNKAILQMKAIKVNR